MISVSFGRIFHVISLNYSQGYERRKEINKHTQTRIFKWFDQDAYIHKICQALTLEPKPLTLLYLLPLLSTLQKPISHFFPKPGKHHVFLPQRKHQYLMYGDV